MSKPDLIELLQSSGKLQGKFERQIELSPTFKINREGKEEGKPTSPHIRPIDAICQTSDWNKHLILASDELTLQSVGELLLANRLYTEAHPHDKPPRLALVCAKADEGAVYLCNKIGIDAFEVADEKVSRLEAKLLR